MEPTLVVVMVGSLILLGGVTGAWAACYLLRVRELRVARAQREVVMELLRLRRTRGGLSRPTGSRLLSDINTDQEPDDDWLV